MPAVLIENPSQSRRRYDCGRRVSALHIWPLSEAQEEEEEEEEVRWRPLRQD